MNPEQLYNKTALSKLLGVPYQTLHSWTTRGLGVEPTHVANTGADDPIPLWDVEAVERWADWTLQRRRAA